jgi:hypothetical protein
VRCSAPGKGCAHPLGKLARTRLLRYVDVTRPVWPGSVQGPFFPLWLPPPCFQKSRASVLPAPNDRHDKSPTARALQQSSLVSSRRTNSRTGQILRSWIVDGDCHLIFKQAAISDRTPIPPSTSRGGPKPNQRTSAPQRLGVSSGSRVVTNFAAKQNCLLSSISKELHRMKDQETSEEFNFTRHAEWRILIPALRTSQNCQPLSK